MAFEYAGNMYGVGSPIVANFQIGATCYVGQLLQWDAVSSGTGGMVVPIEAAAADPDASAVIAGVCTGVVSSPTYNSTYQGDTATLDVGQAAQVANDPAGPTEVEVTVLAPGCMIKAPICFTTIGTAPTLLTVTTGSADGLTFVANALTQATIDDYSTVYCRTGANRGQYRHVTTGNTTTQTMTIAFTYDIAVGDTFVAVNMTRGFTKWHPDSQFQAFAGNDDLAAAFYGYCHQINLEEAGNEWAIVAPAPRHYGAAIAA
jgi:hypothetical protein